MGFEFLKIMLYIMILIFIFIGWETIYDGYKNPSYWKCWGKVKGVVILISCILVWSYTTYVGLDCIIKFSEL